MTMKKLTRREFLRVTGMTAGAAGMAILGQGCNNRPTPTPLIPSTGLTPPTGRYKFPACCSYDNKFAIMHRPKRPLYAKWARPLGDMIDDLNNPDKFPDSLARSPREFDYIKRAVQNCLGFSIDMLFQGDTHSARNGLAAVAEIVTLYFGGYLATYLPPGVDSKAASRIDFYDQSNNIDLWDTIYFPSSSPLDGGLGKPEVTGSAAVKWFTDGKSDLLSRFLKHLQGIADSFDLWLVFGEDLNTTTQEYQQLLQNYERLPSDETNKVISEALIGQLEIDVNNGNTYKEVIAQLVIAFLGLGLQARDYISKQDSENCEENIASMYEINRKITELILEIMRNIDAEAARVREGVVHNASHIWDPILKTADCVNDATVGKLKDSLDDWCGAKKWLVAAGCALLEVPTIIVAINVPWVAPVAIKVAIEEFVLCFLTGMIGSVDVVGEIVDCMMDNDVW